MFFSVCAQAVNYQLVGFFKHHLVSLNAHTNAISFFMVASRSFLWVVQIQFIRHVRIPKRLLKNPTPTLFRPRILFICLNIFFSTLSSFSSSPSSSPSSSASTFSSSSPSSCGLPCVLPVEVVSSSSPRILSDGSSSLPLSARSSLAWCYRRLHQHGGAALGKPRWLDRVKFLTKVPEFASLPVDSSGKLSLSGAVVATRRATTFLHCLVCCLVWRAQLRVHS
eukprot:GHVT01068204.1.p1 GENE.GHVT01068204.1~~GHVT01068204.1.p1  ORF type:complete len:223 (-),score=21.81 GHVT01068204.1:597-1265(-)